MKVRTPNFDYSDLHPHWASTPEAAQMINAGNISPACTEPFVIKVVRRAKGELDPTRDANLLEELELLSKQEGQHGKMHSACLRMVREHGYDGVERYERAYAERYDRLLKTKSLRFLLGYCLAFEALGLAAAEMWIGGHLDRALGADSKPVELFKWHYAEEYEHRDVLFRLYRRLYGRPAFLSYLYRVVLYCYGAVHGNLTEFALTKYLLERDRQGMTKEELTRSKKRERAFGQLMLRGYAPQVLKPLSPFYDPAKFPPPGDVDALLAKY